MQPTETILIILKEGRRIIIPTKVYLIGPIGLGGEFVFFKCKMRIRVKNNKKNNFTANGRFEI